MPQTVSRARDAALVAVFAGVTAALGIVPAITVPALGVPVTAQTLGVMLSGLILGARRGAAAMLVFLALVALGLPLLAGGRGGLGVFASPSAGFILGFPLAAFVVGFVIERAGPTYRIGPALAACVIGGIAALYVPGIIGIAALGHISLGAAAAGAAVFIPGDLIKAVLAAFIARGVHRAYPDLLAGEPGPGD